MLKTHKGWSLKTQTMNNIVAIDFSLNSTALTVFNGDTYKFVSIINTDSFLGKRGKVLSGYLIHDDLEKQKIVKFIKNKRSSQNTVYIDDQKNKLSDAIKIANLIIDLIPKDSIVVMEGFSYSSKSRSFIDLILFASVVRSKIYEKLGNILILSPSEIKKTITGKGNAKKIAVLKGILKTDDIQLIKNSFFDYCNKDLNNLLKKEEVKKPIDDLIDSIAILQCYKIKYL